MKKKGAMELSIGTIVVIVLSVTLLILGIVLIKSIMCSGINLSEQITVGMKEQINQLFGADDIGVRCLGESSGDPPVYGSGGTRAIGCIIKAEGSAYYQLKIDKDSDIVSLSGASASTIKSWIVDSSWEGNVQAGGAGKDVVVLLMNIPRNAPKTSGKLDLTEIKDRDTANSETHTIYFDISPTGFLKTTLC